MRATLVLGLVLAPVLLIAQIANVVVTDAAKFQPGLPAQDSLATIFCTGIVVNGTVTAPVNQPLPFSLGGVSVKVGNVAAPLLAVADLGGYQQINFQVPVGTFVGLSSVDITQGANQTSVIPPAPDSPGEFFGIRGTQFGAFQHARDFSLVTPDNPASPGEPIVGYGTGLLTPSPAVPAGQLTPASPWYPVPQVTTTPTDTTYIALIDGKGAHLPEVDFMGLAPGEVGVYQINFTVPITALPGYSQVEIVRAKCISPSLCSGPAAPGSNFRYSHSQPVLIPVAVPFQPPPLSQASR